MDNDRTLRNSDSRRPDEPFDDRLDDRPLTERPLADGPVERPVDRVPVDRSFDRSVESDQPAAYDQPLEQEAHPNLDPLSGETGAHPIGTGIGATAFGAVGTTIGAAAGPVGAVIGAAIGSVVGGLVGKSAAETVNPTVEEEYWRENYTSRPYARQNSAYEDYQAAYRTGYESYARYHSQGRSYDQLETQLQHDYETSYPQANLPWQDAKYAARDAWDRAEANTLYQDQDAYWRNNYLGQPYYEQGLSYEDYQPAYRTGYENYLRYRSTGRSYEELEPELRRDYEQQYGGSRLGWERARYAVQDAWRRIEQSTHR